MLLQVLGFQPEIKDPFSFIHNMHFREQFNKIGTSTEKPAMKTGIPWHIMEGASFLTLQFYMLTPLCSSFNPAAVSLAMVHIAASWPPMANSLPLKFPNQEKMINPETGDIIRRINWWESSFPNLKELHEVSEEDIQGDPN